MSCVCRAFASNYVYGRGQAKSQYGCLAPGLTNTNTNPNSHCNSTINTKQASQQSCHTVKTQHVAQAPSCAQDSPINASFISIVATWLPRRSGRTKHDIVTTVCCWLASSFPRKCGPGRVLRLGRRRRVGPKEASASLLQITTLIAYARSPPPRFGGREKHVFAGPCLLLSETTNNVKISVDIWNECIDFESLSKLVPCVISLHRGGTWPRTLP